jgi:hypothetical protein
MIFNRTHRRTSIDYQHGAFDCLNRLAKNFKKLKPLNDVK